MNVGVKTAERACMEMCVCVWGGGGGEQDQRYIYIKFAKQ